MVALVDHRQQLGVVVPHLLKELAGDEAEEVEAQNGLVEPKPEVAIEHEREGEGEEEEEEEGADGEEAEGVVLMI